MVVSACSMAARTIGDSPTLHSIWSRSTALIQDIRFAWRLLRRNPAFAAIGIATLALGIGINTAAFTVFNALYCVRCLSANRKRW